MTQPSNPQPPLNERLAEIVLKAIAAGGLTAGGANAFWQLLKDDGSISKAVASAIIGLALPTEPSYYSLFTEAMKNGYKQSVNG